MPALHVRTLRVETLEDRQLLHGGSMAAGLPWEAVESAEAAGYVASLTETSASEQRGSSESEHLAVDAYFGDTEAAAGEHDTWDAAAWGGFGFCVSTVMNQTVLSSSTRGLVVDLRLCRTLIGLVGKKGRLPKVRSRRAVPVA